MSNMAKRLKWYLAAAMVAGFLFGLAQAAYATAGNWFAGFSRDFSSATVTGSKSTIGYKNPNVPVSGSMEWVMVGDGSASHYIQTGWMKKQADSSPLYFSEHGGCSPICRYFHGTVPASNHAYEVSYLWDPNNGGSNWAAYIEGTRVLEAPDLLVGLGTATKRALWSGETWDTADQLGGTSASHLVFTNVLYRDTSNTWISPADSLLTSLTTGGTNYGASKYRSGSYEYVDNWTN